MVFEVPFERIAHLVVVPVELNGLETRFVVDSGIGFTIVRDTFEGCLPSDETFTGKRMSGQEVTVPLGVVPSLRFGGLEQHQLEVGLLDMRGFPDELAEIAGFLSLAFFAETPFTVDYPQGRIVVGGPVEGVALPSRVERDGPAVAMHLPLTLPDGRSIEVEVDMGSDALILDERFLELAAGEVRRVDGTDETGHRYTRRFARLSGRIHPTAAPDLVQDDPDAMFQAIIYDGLLGDGFLRRFAVTFDVAAGTISLA
jgi:Aspartyl protease